MKLHAKNIAKMAGADDRIIDKVVGVMVSEKKVRLDRAKEIIEELTK
jgi:hydroxymethylglutaryl-CoA reductase